MIAVSRGRVRSVGDTPMEASGWINGFGKVSLAFQRFGEVATVTGKLGSGFWNLEVGNPAMRRFLARDQAGQAQGRSWLDVINGLIAGDGETNAPARAGGLPG